MSDEIGVKKAAEQLGIPYYTLSGWRQKRKQYEEQVHVGSGNSRVDPWRQVFLSNQRKFSIGVLPIQGNISNYPHKLIKPCCARLYERKVEWL